MNTERKQTKTEIALEAELERRGIDVEPQFDDGHKRIDLRIKEAKVDIEVDGIQHLVNPYQINKDMDRSYRSFEKGYSTIHISNKDIGEHLKDIADALAEALRFRIFRIKNKFKRK